MSEQFDLTEMKSDRESLAKRIEDILSEFEAKYKGIVVSGLECITTEELTREGPITSRQIKIYTIV